MNFVLSCSDSYKYMYRGMEKVTCPFPSPISHDSEASANFHELFIFMSSAGKRSTTLNRPVRFLMLSGLLGFARYCFSLLHTPTYTQVWLLCFVSLAESWMYSNVRLHPMCKGHRELARSVQWLWLRHFLEIQARDQSHLPRMRIRASDHMSRRNTPSLPALFLRYSTIMPTYTGPDEALESGSDTE